MNPTGASRESLTANPELENSLDPKATITCGPRRSSSSSKLDTLAEQRAGYEGSFLGAMGDRKVIQASLAELADERGVSRDVIWHQVQREVRDALRDPAVWAAVENVAAALVAHGTLVEDEIKHLIRSSGEPPGPCSAIGGRGAPPVAGRSICA